MVSRRTTFRYCACAQPDTRGARAARKARWGGAVRVQPVIGQRAKQAGEMKGRPAYKSAVVGLRPHNRFQRVEVVTRPHHDPAAMIGTAEYVRPADGHPAIFMNQFRCVRSMAKAILSGIAANPSGLEFRQ